MWYEVLVVGGGINGLSACRHLAARGAGRIGLLERFTLGHERGSSHGRSRITRSAYVDADYVRLMQVAHRDSWPRLESDAGCRLIHPTPGCFFGPAGARFLRYEQAVTAAGVDVQPLSPSEAQKRFPMFHFEETDGILDDRTAALVASADTMASLARLVANAGVELREHTEVQAIDASREPIRVETSAGSFETERLVVTAGPWTPRLVPALARHLSVARQTVGYFRLTGSPEDSAPGVFPVWSYLADEGDHGYYGLPEFQRDGVKVARHITSGADDDPDEHPDGTPEEALAELRRFLARRFTSPVRSLSGWESCLYTNTATEDFIIDNHPDHPEIVIGAGFSGHGFKFGPLTGRILAELSLDSKSSLPEFEAARARFAFPAGGAPEEEV